MKLNFLIPKKAKEYIKHIISKTYTNFNLDKRDDYRDYDNLKLKIISTLGKDSTCIDIGCNNGEILEKIIQYSPEAKHYAFEPIPQLAERLKKRFNNKIYFFDIALSDEAGTSEFHFVVSNPAYSGFRKRDYPKDEDISVIKVKTDLLDNIIPKNEKIKLIKVDVEGAEYTVFKGAVETIKRNKPIILFECGKGGSNYYNIKPEQIFDLLTECGLNVSLMEYYVYNRGPLDRHEFLGQYNKGYNYEFIAYPS